MPDRALEGLRVLELGDFISAAYGTKLLADLGADVIKVEPPEGDSIRRHGPFRGDEPNAETGAMHLFLNANKRGITADLDVAEDRERVADLARHADVVLHNLAPARLEALGLAHADLSADAPGLVMVSITPFGYDTPHRDWHGSALVAMAASGLVHRIGDPGREPLAFPYCAADFQGGVHGAITALAALRSRRFTGKGQHAWIALTEVIGTIMAGSGLAPYVFSGQNRERSGFHNPAFYPWQVVPAKDGFIEVITMVDAHWRRFIELMGDPEWADDERLENRWLTFQWADEIDPLWHPWLAERTKAELAETFAENRLPFQPVNTVEEIASSEQLKARDFWVDAEHPDAGAYRTLGAPYRLSETPWRLDRPAPRLGEHTAVIAKQGAWGAPNEVPAGTVSDGEQVLPMQGLRVLDHGHVWAGPLLAEMFADFGAEVLKVRSPNRDSGVAMAGQSALMAARDAPSGDPQTFHGNDRGKLGITVDLSVEEGRELYLQLIEQSDIVIENFAPRVMPSLGLSYEVLAERNPAIILASLSATGATPGPWRDLTTYGPSLSALYGVKSLQGYRGEPRPREDTADLDPTAAAHAMVAICAALEYRERTGRGQYIDLAQGESTMQRIAEPILDYLFNGRVASTQGNRYPGMAPHGIYPAAGDDQWIAIVAPEDAAWAGLLSVAGAAAPTLGEPRFATLEGRLECEDELEAAIAEWTAGHDAFELTEALQHAGVAASPVMDPPTLLVDDNFTALRGAYMRMETEVGLSVDQMFGGIPWKLTETPGAIRLPTPGLGEHNDEVYGRLLGLGEPELAGLRERGVI
jgi:crotonobetainyl-CoA:carnitine CoA-transferase CaiB-like acyl-CoA transferase